MDSIILYDNILEDATLTVTSTSASTGYDKDNLIDGRPYTKWAASSSATQNLDAAFGSSKTADAIGIFNHNLGTIGATVKVQITTGVWTTLLTITPSDDTAILLPFTSNSDADWRIEISGASDPAEIGILMLGEKLSFGYGPETPFAPKSEGIKANSLMSKGGYLLGTDVRYNDLSITARYGYVSRTWVSTYFLPFWRDHARLLKYFFYAYDPDNDADTVYLVKAAESMRYEAPLSIGSYVDGLTLNLVGIAE